MNFYSVGVENFSYRIVQNIQFLQRASSETVDEKHYFFPFLKFEVFFEVFYDPCRQVVAERAFGIVDLFTESAGFAVDTHAEFHFVVADLESGMSCGGNGTGSERETETSYVVDNFVGYGFDFFEFLALFGCGACAFMYQYGTGNASAAYGIKAVLNGDIVVDVNGVDFYSVFLRVAHCVVEVHAVAGVVLYDEQDALVGSAFFNGVINLNLAGRSENVSANGRVEHTFADKTCVSGFVTRSAARYKAYFVVVYIDFLNDFELFYEFEFGMRLGKTVTHIVNKSFGGIHYFFHNFLKLLKLPSG